MRVFIIHSNPNFTGDVRGVDFVNGQSKLMHSIENIRRMKYFINLGFRLQDKEEKDITTDVLGLIEEEETKSKKAKKTPSEILGVQILIEDGDLKFYTGKKDITEMVVQYIKNYKTKTLPSNNPKPVENKSGKGNK